MSEPPRERGRSKFRRGGEDDRPTEGKLDELLADTSAEKLEGPLTAYRDGSRVRRRVYLGLVLGTVVAVLVGRWYVGVLDERARTPTPHYQLAEGTEDEERVDTMVWTDGVARLGLSRQDPGIKAIILPDQIITLAKGCDHAQIKVDVRDGKTMKLKVLVGQIVKTPREPSS